MIHKTDIYTIFDNLKEAKKATRTDFKIWLNEDKTKLLTYNANGFEVTLTKIHCKNYLSKHPCKLTPDELMADIKENAKTAIVKITSLKSRTKLTDNIIKLMVNGLISLNSSPNISLVESSSSESEFISSSSTTTSSTTTLTSAITVYEPYTDDLTKCFKTLYDDDVIGFSKSEVAELDNCYSFGLLNAIDKSIYSIKLIAINSNYSVSILKESTLTNMLERDKHMFLQIIYMCYIPAMICLTNFSKDNLIIMFTKLKEPREFSNNYFTKDDLTIYDVRKEVYIPTLRTGFETRMSKINYKDLNKYTIDMILNSPKIDLYIDNCSKWFNDNHMEFLKTAFNIPYYVGNEIEILKYAILHTKFDKAIKLLKSNPDNIDEFEKQRQTILKIKPEQFVKTTLSEYFKLTIEPTHAIYQNGEICKYSADTNKECIKLKLINKLSVERFNLDLITIQLKNYRYDFNKITNDVLNKELYVYVN